MTLLLIIFFLAAVLIINLPPKAFFKKIAFWLALFLLLLQLVFVFLPRSLWTGLNTLCSSNNFSMVQDSLSMVMLLSIAIVGLVALLVAKAHIKSENKLFNFVCLLLLCCIGMNGMVVVTDLFTLYLFLEIVAAAVYIMIVFEKNQNAYEGAFKYFILSAIATTLMLAGVGLTLSTVGALSFTALQIYFANTAQISAGATIGVLLFMAGLFIKSGLVPFHGWLPDAYQAAPNPVSILLAGIVTKSSGVYALVRLGMLGVLVPESLKTLLLAFGAATILIGALAALWQKDFKRMLAYSSISQVGYIVLSLGAGTLLGYAGAIFHMFNHAILKSLLFVNSAAVESRTGTRDMDAMGGFAAKMPWTGATSVIGALSISGIPPFSGFWSKLVIVIALWKAGLHYYAAFAILASLLTLSYMLYMQRKVFFGKLIEGYDDLREAGFLYILPSVILALITIGLGIGFPFIVGTMLMPVAIFNW